MTEINVQNNIPNPSKINIADPGEIQYWTKALNVDEKRLIEVVNQVGDSISSVCRALHT